MKEEQIADCARATLASSVAAFALGQDADLANRQERGSRETIAVRRLAMYLTYTAFGMSLARCAVAFSRDRSTVAHACQIIEDRRDEDGFDAWVDGLETGLKSLAPYAPPYGEVQ